MKNEWFDIKCPNCNNTFPGKESYLNSAHTCSECKKKVHFIRSPLKTTKTCLKKTKLTNCIACDHNISKNADLCPNCGEPVSKQTPSVSSESQRSVSLSLGFGILFFPYIFSWFTLREGYSKSAKIGAFLWLTFFVLLPFFSLKSTPNITTNTVTHQEAATAKDETFTELKTIANCRESLNTIWYVAENANDVKKVKGTRGESIHIFYKDGRVSSASCNGTVLHIIY